MIIKHSDSGFEVGGYYLACLLALLTIWPSPSSAVSFPSSQFIQYKCIWSLLNPYIVLKFGEQIVFLDNGLYLLGIRNYLVKQVLTN